MQTATAAQLLSGTGAPRLQPEEFPLFQRLLHQLSGIWLTPAKMAMVEGRLLRRLQHHRLASFTAYFRLLGANAAERRAALDLLTTNETHFFREPRHFEFLGQTAAQLRVPGRTLRVWSAACSTGQEPYTIAMVLAKSLPDAPWEVFGSDLSGSALDRARSAIYDISLSKEIPQTFLHAYCLKGVAEQDGRFLIAPQITRKVGFAQLNLNEPLPDIGNFDLIFLRNILIYFRPETKQAVLTRLAQVLRPGGYLLVGHSESLHGLSSELTVTAPTIYRRNT